MSETPLAGSNMVIFESQIIVILWSRLSPGPWLEKTIEAQLFILTVLLQILTVRLSWDFGIIVCCSGCKKAKDRFGKRKIWVCLVLILPGREPNDRNPDKRGHEVNVVTK